MENFHCSAAGWEVKNIWTCTTTPPLVFYSSFSASLWWLPPFWYTASSSDLDQTQTCVTSWIWNILVEISSVSLTPKHLTTSYCQSLPVPSRRGVIHYVGGTASGGDPRLREQRAGQLEWTAPAGPLLRCFHSGARSGLQGAPGGVGCLLALLQRSVQLCGRTLLFFVISFTFHLPGGFRAAVFSDANMFPADSLVLLHGPPQHGCQWAAGAHVHRRLPANPEHCGTRHGADDDEGFIFPTLLRFSGIRATGGPCTQDKFDTLRNLSNQVMMVCLIKCYSTVSKGTVDWPSGTSM